MIIPTLNVVDEAIEQVNDKMKYFEGRTSTLLSDMRDAMRDMTNVKVDQVEAPVNLPKPNAEGYAPISTPDAPNLSVEAPKPFLLDIDISEPPKMPDAPVFSGLGIEIPDSPILNVDLSTPDFISIADIPTVDTSINLPDLPAIILTGLDTGGLPTAINLDGLLSGLDLSDLDLPQTPETPVLNLPDVPSIAVLDLPVKPEIDRDIEIPNAPELILPEMDILEAIVLPEYKADEFPIFDESPPELDVVLPTDLDGIINHANRVIAEDYQTHNKENAIQPLVLEIRQWLAGNHVGLGLPAAVETAFSRGC